MLNYFVGSSLKLNVLMHFSRSQKAINSGCLSVLKSRGKGEVRKISDIPETCNDVFLLDVFPICFLKTDI